MKISLKKVSFLLLPIFIIIVGVFIYNSFINKEVNIDKVLKSKNYSYLSKEAKNYVKRIYKETGTVVLTEKNKKQDLPYLNPKFIEYLELSEKKKQKIELIPDNYIVDYSVSNNYSSNTLPSTYDLRNINNKNYISLIKDQGSTGICWAFASIENVETLLAKQSGQSYSNSIPSFSVRQMDYATSSDHLVKNANWISCSGGCSYQPWDNSKNSSRSLGGPGNFYTSSIVMSNGLSLADENVLPWNENNDALWAKNILGIDKSLYEVNSTISIPMITEDTASEDTINSFVTEVKNDIIQYGGPFVGTYSPQSTCGFENIDGKKALKVDDCANDSSTVSAGHAMQIIGWDDNYNYSYCDAGTKHYSVSNGSCSKGTLTTGKGAWIIRNSWGETDPDVLPYKYVYLAYNSTKMSVGFTTAVSQMSNRSWDNNYHNNPWVNQNIKNGMTSVKNQTVEYNTNNTKSEKVEKIKFLASSRNGKFKLSITSGTKNYNDIASINTDELGIYTIDLSSKNILLDNKTFTVKLETTNNREFYNDSISVFTSNIDKNKYAISNSTKAYDNTKPLSNDNPLYTNVSKVNDKYNWSATVKTNTKNIPQLADLTYRLKKGNTVATSFGDKTVYYDGDTAVASFSGTSSSWNNAFALRDEIGETWTMEILYGDEVINSFPIKFNCSDANTKSTVRVHSNKTSDYYIDMKINDKTTETFESLNGNSNFFNNGYYIESWNTKPDGTGESFDASTGVLVYKDMELYAQWSNTKMKIDVDFVVSDNYSKVITTVPVDYNDKITFVNNTYDNEGKAFSSWKIKYSNNMYSNFYEGESMTQSISSLVSYPVFNHYKYKVYGVWLDDYITISFNSNGGSGTMTSINVSPNTSNKLKSNMFTRDNHVFAGWNTKQDGTGTSYSDGQVINLSENKTLYAQWNEIEDLKITFHANDGTNNSLVQTLSDTNTVQLNKNQFTRNGYKFKGWNLLPDGTGPHYSDKQLVTITSNMDLYAEWEELKAELTATPSSLDFGSLAQDFNTNVSKTVKIKNTGNVKVKLGINNPTSSGPFGSISFQINKVLNPGEEYTATLAVLANGTYHNVPGTYNGVYRITGTDINDSSNIGTVEIPAQVVITKAPQSISYTTHVQNVGWQKYVKNGEMAGTSGRALRLEGIKIKIDNQNYNGNIEYRTHVQNVGWQDYVKNDEMSGTSGRALRLEAIQIRLTGEMAEHYDVYYRVHAQNFGWMNWAKNDEMAGTAGYAYRLEGIEIVLVEKGQNPPVASNLNYRYSFRNLNGDPREALIKYTTHVQNVGWQNYSYDGDMAGTSGRALRLEGIKIDLINKKYSGDIEYRTHVQNIGWQNYVKNGEMSGTSGRALRLEAIQIRLTGEMAEHYDIYYRVHAQNIGWMNWAKNDEMSGTAGYAYRLEGIEIVLVEKGQNPPTRTNMNNSAFIQR